jgi:hypothetical protein
MARFVYSYANFLDWKERASEVAEMAAQRTANLRLSDRRCS